MNSIKSKFALTFVSLFVSSISIAGCQVTENMTTQQGEQILPMLEEVNQFAVLQTLAEQGDAEAQYKLGLMYDLGREIPQNDEKAFEWYEKSANQGLASAQTQLGLMYRHGRGVNVDHSKAVELLFKAYEQGDKVAHYHLGTIYISNENPNH